MTMFRTLRRLRRDTRAVAMTEFALAAPLMLTVGLGGLEAAHLAVTHMRVSQTAMQIADNASRIGDETALLNRPISETDIIDLLMGADLQMGGGLDLYKFGRVIVSSLETDPDDPSGEQQYIHWQRCKGELRVTSSYGDEGDGKGDPSFVGMGPAGQEVLAMPGDAVMFVEVVYEYQPIITDAFVGDRMIRTFASFTVRDSRDLSQIYQEDPLNPVDAATCDTYDRFRTTEKARRGAGGWNWDYDKSSGGSTSGGTSTTSGGTSSTSGGTSTTSGGTSTTSGGTSTTSGGTSTTSGGTSTTSGGTSTTSGGASSGGASSGGKKPK